MRPASNLISAYRPAKSVVEYRNDYGPALSVLLFRRVLDPMEVSPDKHLVFGAGDIQLSADYSAVDYHNDFPAATGFQQLRLRKFVFKWHSKAVIEI